MYRINKRINICLVCVLFLLTGTGVYPVEIPTARTMALQYAFYSFSDEASGVLYNPAVIGLVPTSVVTLTHSPRFLNNNLESVTALRKARKHSIAGVFNLAHNVFKYRDRNDITDGRDINTIYRDGQIDENAARDFDLELSAGYSYPILKQLYAGIALDIDYKKLVDYHHYGTALRLGAIYKFDIPLSFLNEITAGWALDKNFLGNLQKAGTSWEKGVESGFSARFLFQPARTELGLDLVLRSDPQKDYSSTTDFEYYNDQLSYFGFGIEALKYWYVSPRISMGIPFKSDSIFLNGGLASGFDYNGFYYELSYSLASQINTRYSYENISHAISFSLRRSLGQFTTITPQRILLYEGSKLFNTLKESFPPSDQVKLVPLKNGITMSYKKYETLSKNTDIASLQKDSMVLIDNFLNSNPSIKKIKNPEILLIPTIYVTGKIIKMTMMAQDRNGNIIYKSTFEGDYSKRDNIIDEIDTVHMVLSKDNNRIMPMEMESHSRQNRKNLELVFEKWEEDFLAFITKKYIKEVNFPINVIGSLLYVNGDPIAYNTGEPISLFLKPGNYTFLARADGFQDVRIDQNINANVSLPMNFNTDLFKIDINLVLMGEEKTLTAEIGDFKQKFSDKLYMKDLENGKGTMEIRGLSKKVMIPVSYPERKIYTVNLMNDYETDFRQKDDVWQPVVFSENFESSFDRRGLVLTGDSEGENWRGNGISTKPFYMNDMEIQFEAERRKKGDLAFIIMGDDQKKLSVIFKGRTISVTSEYSRESKKGKKGLVKAFRFYEKLINISIVSKNGTIAIYQGSNLIYEGKFTPSRSSQLMFVIDSDKKNENIEYLISKFKYKIL